MTNIKIIDGNLTSEGSLKYGNRPLFITIYDTKCSEKTIYEKDEDDKMIYNKQMFDGHYYINKEGKIFSARPCNTFGEFAQTSDKRITMNDNNIGICLEGDFNIDILNAVQKQSLINLINYIKSIYLSVDKIYFLREIIKDSNTPGDLFPFNQVLADIDKTLVKDQITNLQGEISYRFGSRNLEFISRNQMQGNDVLYLQNLLQLLGYNIEKTGVFNSDTMLIVKKFQSNNELISDGIVNEDDFIILDKLASELTINNKNKFNRLLYYDEKNMLSGKDIERLQSKLIARGYNLTTSSFYDEATYTAVSSFQKQNNIPIDGKVGPITWNTIINFEPTISRLLYFTMPMMYGNDVTLLQQRLCIIGYTCPVSGYFDNITEMQIKLLQSRNNLVVTGRVDEDTSKIIFN